MPKKTLAQIFLFIANWQIGGTTGAIPLEDPASRGGHFMNVELAHRGDNWRNPFGGPCPPWGSIHAHMDLASRSAKIHECRTRHNWRNALDSCILNPPQLAPPPPPPPRARTHARVCVARDSEFIRLLSLCFVLLPCVGNKT